MKEYMVSVALPIALSVLTMGGSIGGAYLTAKSAVRASDVEMAKLAVQLLQDEGTSKSLKDWSVRILGEYTDVPMTPEERSSIVDKIDAEQTTLVPWKIDDPKIQAIYRALDAKGVAPQLFQNAPR